MHHLQHRPKKREQPTPGAGSESVLRLQMSVDGSFLRLISALFKAGINLSGKAPFVSEGGDLVRQRG